jgi:hypothetical protein
MVPHLHLLSEIKGIQFAYFSSGEYDMPAIHHGGEKPGGGGYGRTENHEPMRKGGKKR